MHTCVGIPIHLSKRQRFSAIKGHNTFPEMSTMKYNYERKTTWSSISVFYHFNAKLHVYENDHKIMFLMIGSGEGGKRKHKPKTSPKPTTE